VLARVSARVSCHKRQASRSVSCSSRGHREDLCRDRQDGETGRGHAVSGWLQLSTTLLSIWCLVRACRSMVTASSHSHAGMLFIAVDSISVMNPSLMSKLLASPGSYGLRSLSKVRKLPSMFCRFGSQASCICPGNASLHQRISAERDPQQR
jgi:hypothetical protein